MTHNEKYEVPDEGPTWACAQYGLPGHDYMTCKHCETLFEEYMSNNRMALAGL